LVRPWPSSQGLFPEIASNLQNCFIAFNSRSGEMCKRRWEQMQRSLGREPVLRHLHFLEKLEGVVTRFAPHLADAEYDPQFAAELEQADADESEDNVDI